MKNTYKYLVKLTTKAPEHTTIIIAKTNDVEECNKLARETREWLAKFKNNPMFKDFAESTVHVSTAPEGCNYA